MHLVVARDRENCGCLRRQAAQNIEEKGGKEGR